MMVSNLTEFIFPAYWRPEHRQHICSRFFCVMQAVLYTRATFHLSRAINLVKQNTKVSWLEDNKVMDPSMDLMTQQVSQMIELQTGSKFPHHLNMPGFYSGNLKGKLVSHVNERLVFLSNVLYCQLLCFVRSWAFYRSWKWWVFTARCRQYGSGGCSGWMLVTAAGTIWPLFLIYRPHG